MQRSNNIFFKQHTVIKAILGMAKMRQSRVNKEYQVMNVPYCSEGSIPLLVSLKLEKKKVGMKIF